MKYAIVILVVLLGVWLWRKNRADDRKEMGGKPQHRNSVHTSAPQIMVSCAACGLHLPQSDAVLGRTKYYCSLAHLQQREP